MIESEDWDKLYYAIIQIRSGKHISIKGIGSTKLICRNSALDTRMKMNVRTSEKYIRMLETLDIGFNKNYVHHSVYAMVYCEAKVYIYGKRYGYKDMILVYDPAYAEDLIRFAGYKKNIKKS